MHTVYAEHEWMEASLELYELSEIFNIDAVVHQFVIIHVKCNYWKCWCVHAIWRLNISLWIQWINGELRYQKWPEMLRTVEKRRTAVRPDPHRRIPIKIKLFAQIYPKKVIFYYPSLHHCHLLKRYDCLLNHDASPQWPAGHTYADGLSVKFELYAAKMAHYSHRKF